MQDKAAQQSILSIIQPGTRVGFRRRVFETLRATLSAESGFFFLGRDPVRAYADGTLFRGTQASPIPPGTHSLTSAFGVDLRSVVESSRRVYLAKELFPTERAHQPPYFQQHGTESSDTILIFLHEGGILFGLIGLERLSQGNAVGPTTFSDQDAAQLEALGPILLAGVRAQLSYEDLSREAAALRALHKVRGALFVIDREHKRVVWAANRARGIDWTDDVAPYEQDLASAAEAFLAAKARGEPLPTPRPLPIGVIQSVAKVEDEAVFGLGSFAVVRTEQTGEPGAMEGLSKREREIARLLVAGYSGVNIAAIAGLSENTVRTYVRRLYAKLGVNNRADLVRNLMAPEPASSVLTPPVDSSLAYGDDTLD
jgi:DNA-binding CsgD family transcriptional regulator